MISTPLLYSRVLPPPECYRCVQACLAKHAPQKYTPLPAKLVERVVLHCKVDSAMQTFLPTGARTTTPRRQWSFIFNYLGRYVGWFVDPWSRFNSQIPRLHNEPRCNSLEDYSSLALLSFHWCENPKQQQQQPQPTTTSKCPRR
jgi:hypothetical protein